MNGAMPGWYMVIIMFPCISIKYCDTTYSDNRWGCEQSHVVTSAPHQSQVSVTCSIVVTDTITVTRSVTHDTDIDNTDNFIKTCLFISDRN